MCFRLQFPFQTIFIDLLYYWLHTRQTVHSSGQLLCCQIHMVEKTFGGSTPYPLAIQILYRRYLYQHDDKINV